MSIGILNSSQLPVDFGKKSFDQMITRLMPNGQAPLFGLTSMLGSENAVNIEHGFFTKTMLFPQLTLAAGATATDTVLTVTSTANVIPGFVMQVQSTKENIIVNNVISPTQVSVGRGIGNVAAAIISNGVKLYQVGNAFEQGSIRPNAVNINPVRITNLTQIFRNTWAITDTMRNIMTIAGETNLAESKLDCASFHAAEIERAIIFGQKSQSTRNGQPFSTMDGLISIIGNLAYYPSSYAAANVSTAGSTTNLTQLEAMLDPVFDQTTDAKVANERLLFVGGTARKALNAIGRLSGQYQIIQGQTEWGLQFDTFKLSRGSFRVIEHPQFNSNADWSKMAVAVDLSTFKLAYLGDRKTQHKPMNAAGQEIAVDNGIDAVGGTLTTELTTVVKNPPANAVVYNLTAGAAG
jgi:hypothetical protein